MQKYCNSCKAQITEDEYAYSMQKFSKPLCRKHQKPEPTEEAKKLGTLLKKYGHRIELEKSDGFKHIDIAIVNARVNIEVDGSHHNLTSKQALADLKRTFYSFKKDYLTLRIPNSLVRDDKTIEETAKFIDKFLKESTKQMEDDDDWFSF